MILIDHYVGKSAVHGVGLFTAQALKKGQLIYQFDYRFVQVIADSEIRLMPAPMQETMKKYAYRGKGKDKLVGAVYYCTDDSRFMNHAATPSTTCVNGDDYIAARDLPAGSELTCDYSDFCDEGEMCFQL